jgi:cell division protein FtsX
VRDRLPIGRIHAQLSQATSKNTKATALEKASHDNGIDRIALLGREQSVREAIRVIERINVIRVSKSAHACLPIFTTVTMFTISTPPCR